MTLAMATHRISAYYRSNTAKKVLFEKLCVKWIRKLLNHNIKFLRQKIIYNPVLSKYSSQNSS